MWFNILKLYKKKNNLHINKQIEIENKNFNLKTFEFLTISTNLSEHFSLIQIKKKICENANAEQLINAPK